MNKPPKVLCSICVRRGSQGLPNKNMLPLAGIPLFAHSIQTALKSKVFEQVVVSTDCEEMMQIAKEFGASVLFKRPAELATAESSKIPVIRHAFLAAEEHFGQRYDISVDLDATSPLRIVDDIKDSLSYFIQEDFDNLITGCKARRSPYFNLVERKPDGRIATVMDTDYRIKRRQNSPECFDLNASIYIWKRDVLVENDKLFLQRTGFFEMPEERSFDIDSELDFLIVEAIYKDRT